MIWKVLFFVVLLWSPNTEPDLLGYKVYSGRGLELMSSIYTGKPYEFNSPEDTSQIITDIILRDTTAFISVAEYGYYFFVTALDSALNESLPSEIVSIDHRVLPEVNMTSYSSVASVYNIWITVDNEYDLYIDGVKEDDDSLDGSSMWESWDYYNPVLPNNDHELTIVARNIDGPAGLLFVIRYKDNLIISDENIEGAVVIANFGEGEWSNYTNNDLYNLELPEGTKWIWKQGNPKEVEFKVRLE